MRVVRLPQTLHTGMLVVGMLAAAAAVAPAAASAPAASAYCSESGDLCFGIAHRRGDVVFRIDTFARYFGRYRLCVRPPGGPAACGAFPVFRNGRLWSSRIRWTRQYPDRGRGVYRVTWRLGRTPLGPTLTFRR